MKVKELIAFVVVIVGILTIILMYFALSSGDIEKGTEILAESVTPWWLNPVVWLSSSSVGIIILFLILLFKDKIGNINIG